LKQRIGQRLNNTNKNVKRIPQSDNNTRGIIKTAIRLRLNVKIVVQAIEK
jgi:hypothetical protein